MKISKLVFVRNENNLVNSIELSKYFNSIDKIIKNQDLIFKSNNKINFFIDKK